MAKSKTVLPVVFRGLSKYSKTFKLEAGPLRASGVPALFVGVAGIVLATGVAGALVKVGNGLPETLRELRGFVEALRARPKARLAP
ncbi:MAG: hypothetical protein ACLQPV_08745 [Vulcanimicrobiaceae bacterium]